MRFFFFPYEGGKFRETKQIIKLLNLKFDNIDTIVEPFCGSCGFSNYVYQNAQYNKSFYFSDNDKL